jgi:excisionase family DNA binding protein
MKILDIDPALKLKDVAELLSFHQKTIYRLAKKGEIPGFKVLGFWRFQRNYIVDWVAAQEKITQKNDRENYH